MKLLALTAILPAAASLFFPAFWLGFPFFRRHRVLTYAMIAGTLAALALAVHLLRAHVFAWHVDLPLWTHILGWLVIAAATTFGFVADRQLGLRVRTFTPFFEDRGHIELKTTGAYAVVRHPIYTAGLAYQLGVFLATGYLAILPAFAAFLLGALWFTRQEERRLIELLDDPSAYERYRTRVPALLPLPRPRERRE